MTFVGWSQIAIVLALTLIAAIPLSGLIVKIYAGEANVLDASADLAFVPDITLADGATSPTINAASFFDFVAQPATVHRTASTITAHFLSRPGGVRSQTLNFSAFGHAPKISPPKTFKPCTTTAGD